MVSHLAILAMTLAVASGAPLAIDNNVLCEIPIFDRCYSEGSCGNACAVLPACLSEGHAGGFYFTIPWTRRYECRDRYGSKITFVDCQQCQTEPNSASEYLASLKAAQTTEPQWTSSKWAATATTRPLLQTTTDQEPKVPIAKTPLWNTVVVTVQTSVWNTYAMALCAAAMMILAGVMCFRNRRFCSKDYLKSGVLLTP